MNFELTDVQREIQRMCREFAAKELTPNARKWDEHHTWPTDAVKKLAELSLLGVAVPEQYGGAGLDNVCYALAMEEISRGCASTGVIMSVNNSLYCDPVMKFGTEAQKEEFLTPFARGDKLGCFGLTEPEAGSDAAAQQTVAVRRGDEYIINGSKNWITNGPKADAIVLFTMTNKEAGHKGITAFLVPTNTPGFTRAEPDKKMGISAAWSCSMFFEDMRVPAKNLLGKEGEGFKVAMSTLDGGRIGIASQALGIARAAYEEAVRYSGERKSFGKPIREHQAIQFMIADMAMEIDAARLLIWRAALLKDKGVRHSAESAMAKLFASEMANRVTNKALQVHGGMGYSKEMDAERHVRDARITEIYEGTSEIQRIVISANVLKE
ncbi:acyl-CoA dehydrogenase [Myxococcus sp. MISCRS1]|uniref:Cyclohexane-1-carbonyl-CoA dehydrogenase n=1 Tax=Myxococcus fulvus TaxID=33 RepID=A0A511THR6_MYXFU|nr:MULTISPECIES: acyl-CoA dehydrogenase [Myxococcus]AKF81668.1 acyl-CoA dehydrogenase [Myxococcus fulvus 124B02]MCP3061678.1 acyl-CoA dehydrogenase [Myxococcus guangdongensis]MCY1003756.1 acyl-CoA dehydrogenase [Myxococcus sp. MISCRS1]SET87308.1 Acyl-CoA dehydrogenase [Myxococcus fulvus]GEN12892.1 acyl-CoA dehydrogenase [Myxococcus fulvus]